MKNIYLVANWKSNKTVSESLEWIRNFKFQISNFKLNDKIIIILCAPFTISAVLQEEITKLHLPIYVGAQNLSLFPSGPYTGEVSGEMLKGLATHCIVGHSERRQNFGETNTIVNQKIFNTLEQSLVPIVCVGETLEEKEQGLTEKIVEDQLKGSLKNITKEQMSHILISYEPLWAISKGDGKGKTATPDDAEEMHIFIRDTLATMYPTEERENFSILYGGSVNKDNVKSLMQKPNINGYLVGGASLDPEHFSKIIEAFSSYV
jgi:triosephosphate isomerase